MGTTVAAKKPTFLWEQALPDMEDRKEPWNRQPWEDDDKWHHFRNYLMMPAPRDLARSAAAIGASAYQMEKTARKGHWKVRAMAYDRHVQGLWTKAVAERIEINADNYAQHHTKILAQGTELATRELEKYLEASRSTTGKGLIKVGELTKLISEMIKLHRLQNGESTENIAVRDLSNMSIADIRELKRLEELAYAAEDSE